MNNRHPVSEARPPERLLPFWRALRELIAALWASFGGPEDIAARGLLSRADHAWIGQALRGMEAALRRLIFIAAANVTPSSAKPTSRAIPKLAAGAMDPAKPETWRVRFKLTPHRSTSSRRDQAREPENLAPSFPLAARFEALLRAFDAPEIYVRRAARLLRKTKTIMQRLCTMPRGVPYRAGLSLLEEIAALMKREDPALNSS